jgi:hypothetical protein
MRRTNLKCRTKLGTTLTCLFVRYERRNAATSKKRQIGSIKRIVSSKSRVKSKPPLQSPAYGPKVLSLLLQATYVDACARSDRDGEIMLNQ